MIAASSLTWFDIFVFKSSILTFPFSSHSTTTTFMPAITAEAAFVPCALDGIRQIVLPLSPRES